MSKAIRFKNSIYIDSSGISHNKKILKDILNEGLNKTALFWNVPSVGEIGILSKPGSNYTVNGSFSSYDFLLVVFKSRVWGWCEKQEVIFNRGQFEETAISTSNLYSALMPLYNTNTIASMQYYFTNNNKVTVYYNTHYSGDNHMYISAIYGCNILETK